MGLKLYPWPLLHIPPKKTIKHLPLLSATFSLSAWKNENKQKKNNNTEVPNETLEDVIIDFRLSLNFCIFFGGLILCGKP